MQDKNSHSHVYVAKYNHLLLVSIVLRFQSYQWRKKKKKNWIFLMVVCYSYTNILARLLVLFFLNLILIIERKTWSWPYMTGLSCHPYLRLVFCMAKNRMWLSSKLTQFVITFIFPLFLCKWQRCMFLATKRPKH